MEKIKTESLYALGNNASRKTPEKMNPPENTQNKKLYILGSCIWDFLGTLRNLETYCGLSGLTEKYFFATVFQSNIRKKTTSGFLKCLEDITIKRILASSQ